ncbi:hypothetical protein [Bosea sp. PAMC 26642]|uniref:hypothetical protein n=1 Tax=Bosea sp. (strain PAMC 26642) TaxID=1792307 RepID=UPI001439E18A|nr:hypothetical protein [Bosea sp. PAMC 26642]
MPPRLMSKPALAFAAPAVTSVIDQPAPRRPHRANPAILAGLMVNEWLRRLKNLRGEPFPERTVILLPRCSRIAPLNSERVDNTGSEQPQYLEKLVDRRSFVVSLFGGLAVAGLGGASIAQAATPKSDPAPAAPAAGAINTATKAGLDQADADFNQVVIRERVVRRRGPYERGPYRRRPVVVRRRVVVRRPRRVIRRRVIVR